MEGDDSANREAVREMLTNLVVDHHMKKGNLRIKSSSQLLPMKLLSQRAIYPKLVQFFKDWHPALLRGLWAAMRLDEDTCIDLSLIHI